MATDPTTPTAGLPTLAERKTSSGSLSIDEKDPRVYDKDVSDKEDGSEVARDLEVDVQQLERLAQLAEQISDEEAETIMREVLEEHRQVVLPPPSCWKSCLQLHYRHDPSYPNTVLEVAKRFFEDPNLKDDPILYQRTLKELKMETALIVHDSPYVEVRAVVSSEDDPSTPCSTVRAWTIGLLFACTGALINQLFSLRYPRIEIDEIVAQLLAYPAGTAWARWMPNKSINLFGYNLALNPGSFNRKEHMLITIMANVSFGVGYSAYVIVVQRVPTFFNQEWAKQIGYQISLSLSFQLMGYGLAGLSRRFLVYPAAAIWPRNLASIALNNSFHANTNPIVNGWKISQMRFFLYSFGGMFVYFWFPNYIIGAMSYFSWIAWIKPESAILAAVAGTNTGLGLNPLPTFDWKYTGHLPINSNRPFDRYGKQYKVTSVVDDNGFYDQAAYEAYSPLYLSAGQAFLYGSFFAVYPATLVYAFLYHRHEIVRGFKSLIKRKDPRQDNKDVHNRLMAAYPEAPEWWYASILLLAIGLGLIAILCYPTHTTVGALFMGLALALIFVVPIGVIFAVTNQEVTLNVLAEFIGGVLFPGNALAMNMFKSYGYVVTARTLRFASDLKLGHYTKINPRVLFISQTIATIISTLVAMSIMNWQVNSIRGVCTPEAQAKFTCPGTSTFFTASVIWGTLGPIKMYGADGPYNILLYGFLIGAALPVIFFFLAKRFPNNKVIRGIHAPIFLAGGLNWAPYNLSHTWPAVVIGYIFQVHIRKRYIGWWQKYNYVLTSALTCGVAIAAIVTFFALQWSGIEIDWRGNSIVGEGCDGTGCPLLPVPEKGYWGPGPGEFH
ncbi:Sexual differentiation process protein isp4 [Rhizoctonia solani AG-1 IB]|uniref:Sexual differentiation process protein isp4 n=1 Tax=Thanatephorus cucumeris (strain AG1-IB / isolate 7/3/14) TaxID=1108050 RepID=M5CDR8_THACB|nr:Sexual differentiation process protein isp4 [Rhizoctonia solani AG-1 IB]